METIAKDEFRKWFIDHQLQFPHKGWEKPKIDNGNGEMVVNPDWQTRAKSWYAFVTEIGASVEELRAATQQLLRTPPAFLEAHLPAIENAVKLIRQKKKATNAKQAEVDTSGKKGDEAYHPDLNRDVCEQRSAGCPECAGCGFAMRLVEVDGLPYPSRTTLFCRCPMGRWMLEHYKANEREQYSRIADLQAQPGLWNTELRFDAWAETPTPFEETKAGSMIAGHFLAPTELGGYPVLPPGEGIQAVVDSDEPDDYPAPPRRFNDEDDDEPPFDVEVPKYNPNS